MAASIKDASMAQSSVNLGAVVAAHGDAGSELGVGEFLYRQQIKFAVLQSLVLAELMLTSSSLTVYGLGSGGIVVLWLLTSVMKDDESSKLALAILFPSLLMCATMLLTIIVLVKVFFIGEQTDLSLFFLGMAFTIDHFLLVFEGIPGIVKMVLVGGGVAANNAERGFQGGNSCADRFPTLAYISDKIMAFNVMLVSIFAFVLTGLHAPIALPIRWLFFKFKADSVFDNWEASEANRRLARDDPEMGEDTKAAAMNSFRIAVLFFVTVVIVDLEFVIVAISMAFFTGGAQVGGEPIAAGGEFDDCCCGSSFVGNATACSISLT